MAVRRGADADGKQTACTEALLDQRKQRLLVAYGAVGEEDHLANPLAAILAGERLVQCAGHLGAAPGAQSFDPANRILDIGVAGGASVVEERMAVRN